MNPNIDLHIEQLILHNMPAYQRHAIAQATEQNLRQLLTELGLPQHLRDSSQILIPKQSITVQEGLKPDIMAKHIAQSLYAYLVEGE